MSTRMIWRGPTSIEALINTINSNIKNIDLLIGGERVQFPKFDWVKIARETGIVLGFVSIFLAWITTDFLTRLEIPMTRFIDLSNIWSLLQLWPYLLGPISGLIFLSGCILLLFTRWGAIAQIIGLITFVSFYLLTYGGEQGNLGIGFYLGIISAVVSFIIEFVVKGDQFTIPTKI